MWQWWRNFVKYTVVLPGSFGHFGQISNHDKDRSLSDSWRFYYTVLRQYAEGSQGGSYWQLELRIPGSGRTSTPPSPAGLMTELMQVIRIEELTVLLQDTYLKSVATSRAWITCPRFRHNFKQNKFLAIHSLLPICWRLHRGGTETSKFFILLSFIQSYFNFLEPSISISWNLNTCHQCNKWAIARLPLIINLVESL